MQPEFHHRLGPSLRATLIVLCLFVPCQHSKAQELKFTTTWIGNSFGGGPKWVQNFVEGMKVLPDGTVLVASTWDETGREFGIYKDGDVVGLCKDTHGWGTGGGPSVAATEKYLFIYRPFTGQRRRWLEGRRVPAER